MVAIRTVTTKNKEGVLIFEEFDSEIKPIKVLDQVWLSVTNVPTPLRAFLPLWAVGSVVGATQKVDMDHLRRTGEVRILVAVFDVKDIPKMADICVNRSIYRVYFNVEEVVDDDPFNPEDDDLLGDDADTGRNDESQRGMDGNGDHHMADAPEDTTPQPEAPTGNQVGKTTPVLSQQEAALVDEVIDKACDELLEEISIKVIVETDGEDRPYSPPTEEEYVRFRALVDSSKQMHTRPLECEVTADSLDGSLPAAASPFVVQEPVAEEAPVAAAPLFSDGIQYLTVGDTDGSILPGDDTLPYSSVGSQAIPASPSSTGGGQALPVLSSAVGGGKEVPASSSTVGVSQVPPAVSSLSDGGQAPTPVATVSLKTTTIRRSARNKDKADEHTLHKTSLVAAKKNLEPGTSFISFFRFACYFKPW